MRLSELVKFLIRSRLIPEILRAWTAKHVHFSCDLPGLRFLVPVGPSPLPPPLFPTAKRCNWTRSKLNFAQGNEKEADGAAACRRTLPRRYPKTRVSLSLLEEGRGIPFPFSRFLRLEEKEEEEEEEEEKGFLNKSLRHPHARMLDEDILRRGGERYAGTFLQRYFLQSIEGSIFLFFFSFQRMRYLIRERTIGQKSYIHRLKRVWIFCVCI